jgi:cell division septation protein DedD
LIAQLLITECKQAIRFGAFFADALLVSIFFIKRHNCDSPGMLMIKSIVKKKTVIKGPLLFLLLFSLSACSTTQNLSELLAINKKAESQEKNDMIGAHMEEWNMLKPRLTEIVKLESELRYLIKQIGAVESLPGMNVSLREPQDAVFKDPAFSMSEDLERVLDLSIEQTKNFAQDGDAELVYTFDANADTNSTENFDYESENKITNNIDVNADIKRVENFDHESQNKIALNIDANSQRALIDSYEPSVDKQTIENFDANSEQALVSSLQWIAAAQDINNSLLPTTPLSTSIVASKVKVGRAQPLILSTSKQITNKFSNTTAGSPTNSQVQTSSPGVQDDKFSTVKTFSNDRLVTNTLLTNSIVGAIDNSNAVPRNSNTVACQPSTPPRQGAIGIHLVSYSSLAAAQNGWRALKQTYNEQLCEKRAAIKEVNINNSIFYSVRIGAFDNTDEAQETCTTFKNKGQYCVPSVFEGVLVL